MLHGDVVALRVLPSDHHLPWLRGHVDAQRRFRSLGRAAARGDAQGRLTPLTGALVVMRPVRHVVPLREGL